MGTEFFKWSDKYSVDIEEIDNQHKKLFSLINELYYGFMKRSDDQIIDDILKQLFDYTHYHFTKEEEYFARFRYENADEHIMEHISFVEKLRELKEQKDQDTKITSRLMSFLRNWLTNHIRVEDKKYKQCFKSHGL